MKWATIQSPLQAFNDATTDVIIFKLFVSVYKKPSLVLWLLLVQQQRQQQQQQLHYVPIFYGKVCCCNNIPDYGMQQRK